MKTLSISQLVKQASKDTNLLIKKTADFDGDGVLNHRDCQPLNPRKQHVEPNILMRRRIERLPIYVTDEIIPSTGKTITFYSYHLSDVDARRYAPIARKRILSILKKYPDLITQIERKKPQIIYVTSKPDPDGKLTGTAYPQKRGKGIVVIYALSEESSFKVKKMFEEHGIRRGDIAYSGGVVRHELEHIRQFKEGSRGGVLRPKVSRRIIKGEYEERPEEKQAMRAERRLHRKYLRERSKGGIAGFFRRLF